MLKRPQKSRRLADLVERSPVRLASGPVLLHLLFEPITPRTASPFLTRHFEIKEAPLRLQGVVHGHFPKFLKDKRLLCQNFKLSMTI